MALASAMNMTGLDSAKPTSGFIAGRIYIATDTSKLYYDNGSALVAYTFGAGGGAGAVTLITDTIVSGSVAANIDFASIPGTYKHLRVEGQVRGDTAATNSQMRLRMNADSTAAHYQWNFAEFYSGSTANGVENSSDTAISVGRMSAATASSGASGMFVFDIPNYVNTVFNKMINGTNGNVLATGNGGMASAVNTGVWLSTAAITELTFTFLAGNFIIGSRISLYGIS